MSVLEVVDVCKSFGVVKVLDGISFTLEMGMVLGLAGENGAGKSTLMKCISGALKQSSGSVNISSDDSGRAKCYMVPQEFTLIGEMSVVENLFLGREICKNGGLLDKKQMRVIARNLLKKVNANFDVDELVDDLGVADRQKIEIAKAFLTESSLVIFDEPTTVLNADETHDLFKLIRHLKETGVSVIYISHKLDEVLEICDEIAVLRDGKLVVKKESSEFTAKTLAESMVGRSLSKLFPTKENTQTTRVALELVGVSDKDRVLDASFKLYEGEILGLAGLAGAGRTELSEIICGVRKKKAGKILINDEEKSIASMRSAIKNGVTYLPEDRQSTAMVLNFSIADNVVLASLSKYLSCGVIDKTKISKSVSKLADELNIKCESIDALVNSLSGGNQQKVSIAKCLDNCPKIFIFDEPTRGVDVGARYDIYEIIHGLAKKGVAILLISSDLEEIIGNCNRVLVMHEGKIVGEVSGEDVNEKRIMELAHNL